MPLKNIQHFHLGECNCCGSDMACTRGIVELDGDRTARYLVKWTVGKAAHGMGWLISLPSQTHGKEVAVCLGYSFEHRSFMVRYRGDYEWSAAELAGFGELLDRDQVVGTPLAGEVFGIVDEVWLNDPYVSEFVESVRSGEE